MNGLPYLLPFVVPVAITAGYFTDAVWPYRLTPWIFVTVTILDTLVGRTRPSGTHVARAGIIWRLAIWMWLPAQAAIVFFGLVTVASRPFQWAEAFGIAMSVGMSGGMLNVPVAHELMHGRSRIEGLLAEALLCLMSYPHFRVEHLHGHHVRVATVEDPATARMGETVYAFYPRVLMGCWKSAWRLEADRMRRTHRSIASLQNRVLRGVLELAAIYLVVWYVFGLVGVVFFVTQSLIGILMLETINYVQHYGLVRQQTADGRPERITEQHAWNSSHPVSNWFLLNLGRHSDHHCDAGKGYRVLDLSAAAPQLPTGLFGMFVLALYPPLWRSIMDPLVERLRASRQITTSL